MAKSAALESLVAAVGQPKASAQAPVIPVLPKVPISTENKFKVLDQIKKELDKQFNTTTSIVRLGNKVGANLPSLPTGIYTLDYEVIGCGGIPKGRIIELYGPESSGKTTFALHCIAQDQRRGELCAYIDAEHALDPSYMQSLGVDVDNLLVSQPDSGEQALETAEALVESNAISLIVVDSVAALVPQAELDGEMGDSHMGLHARLMSQAMRKLRGKCARNGVTIIFINQIREKIGVMFGSPETTTGGRALKFYASVRLDVRKVSGEDGKGKVMSGGVQIGHVMRIRAVKNKVGTPARSTEVDLIYGVGFDTEADFATYAVNTGAIQQSGAWFQLPGGFDKVQGINAVKQLLKSNSEAKAAVVTEVEKARAAQKESNQ
jgi:recombination protein RecA